MSGMWQEKGRKNNVALFKFMWVMRIMLSSRIITFHLRLTDAGSLPASESRIRTFTVAD